MSTHKVPFVAKMKKMSNHKVCFDVKIKKCIKTYLVGTHWNCLNGAILMSTTRYVLMLK